MPWEYGLKNNGCPWNEESICHAAVYHHFEVMTWLKETGAPIPNAIFAEEGLGMVQSYKACENTDIALDLFKSKLSMGIHLRKTNRLNYTRK